MSIRCLKQDTNALTAFYYLLSSGLWFCEAKFVHFISLQPSHYYSLSLSSEPRRPSSVWTCNVQLQTSKEDWSQHSTQSRDDSQTGQTTPPQSRGHWDQPGPHWPKVCGSRSTSWWAGLQPQHPGSQVILLLLLLLITINFINN